MSNSLLPGKQFANLARNAGRRSFSMSLSLTAAAEVKRLGVVGAGQMGLGIALVAAQKAGVPVTLVDTSQASLDKGMRFADKLLEKDVSKQRITQSDADSARSLLSPTTDMEHLSKVDFVIEAVPEIPSLKMDIFAQLARIAPSHAILATNTSSISITKIAASTTPPDNPTDLTAASRVISTHFMNPVPIQKGVEIISGLQTSPETRETAIEFCKRMGKIPSQSADSPGFLANRILMPYINEAIICLETGVGTKEDIDNIMKNGTNVPMGPLQLADFIGIDTCLAIMKVLHEETGDGKYRPAVLLRKMVDAGLSSTAGTAQSRASPRLLNPIAALPPIQPCYDSNIGGESRNCSVVCDTSYLLFDPQHPSTLVTCGLWASVSASLEQTRKYPNATPFDVVGLNVSELENTQLGAIYGGLSLDKSLLQESLVSCFASFYAATHSLTHNISSTSNSCSATALLREPEPCFADLCAPRSLDADLGGIAVLASLIIQSSIAIVTAFVLPISIPWLAVKSHRQRKHFQAVMIATVNFPIAQCYFAGAMQIAALVFTARDLPLIRWIASPELLDAGLLFTLATNGFIPTILTLAVVTQYGRQSWYLISLSSIVFILSTGMLAASSNAWYTASFDPEYGVLASCGDFVASNLSTSWCGSNNLFSNSGHSPTTINKVIWVMWAHSFLWLLDSVLKKFGYQIASCQGITKLGSICRPRFALSDHLRTGRLAGRPSLALFAITWSLSLGYQLWLYAVILRGSTTNHTWSFGQILAVSIWAPCLAEFINLELNGVFKGSEYRYPPPLALAITTDPFGAVHLGNNDSTANIIPLTTVSDRRSDGAGSDIGRGEQLPAEAI